MTQRKVRADGLLQKSFRIKIAGVSKQFVVYGHSEEELLEKEQQKRKDIELKLHSLKQPKPQVNARLGAVGRNYNNRQMHICAYRNSEDIDVQFEDGIEVTHIAYIDFTHGYVDHPLDSEDSKPTCRGVGESRINIQGLHMTIVKWINDKDISVLFDDGTVVEHKRYSKFGAGCIQNPNVRKITDRVGETNISTQGQLMTIIAYHNAYDIDIQFEDGTVVAHKRYPLFQRGYVTNPNFGKNLESPVQIEGRAYVYKGIFNYYCRCTKCGRKDIMTISEMKSHICQ